jgi:hypothetical protein
MTNLGERTASSSRQVAVAPGVVAVYSRADVAARSEVLTVMFRQDAARRLMAADDAAVYAVAVDAIAPWLPALAERVVDSRVTRWHEAMPVPLGHAGGAALPRPAARDQSATACRRLPRLPVLRLRRFQWTLGRGQADRRSRRLSRAHVCPHRVGAYQPDLVAMQTPYGAAMSPTVTHRSAMSQPDGLSRPRYETVLRSGRWRLCVCLWRAGLGFWGGGWCHSSWPTVTR